MEHTSCDNGMLLYSDEDDSLFYRKPMLITTLIDGCSLELCSATPSVASSGICHRYKVNSIA